MALAKIALNEEGQIMMRLVQSPIGTFIPYLKMTDGVHFQVARPARSAREGKRAGYQAICDRIKGTKISTKNLSWELDYPVKDTI